VPSVPSTSASPPPTVPEQPQQGWEEPTTVQAPVWEEEPPKPSVSTPDGWTVTQETNEQGREQEQPSPAETGEVVPITTPAPAPQQEAPAPKEAEPQPIAPIQPAINVPVVAATPSPKLAGRSAAGSHRLSARYKTTDQPVVMPNSFGASIEKAGMQFGSLSLGGDSLDNNL
jgi:hypothetical protein